MFFYQERLFFAVSPVFICKKTGKELIFWEKNVKMKDNVI